MLALIAGTGNLPPLLFSRLTAEGEQVFVCALAGFDPQIKPQFIFRIEELGSLLIALKSRGVTDICMAGAVRRPDIDPSAIDDATAPLIPQLQAAMALGDDGALRGIIALLEEQEFNVIGAAELLPELLPPSGVLSGASPNARHKADAELGDAALLEMAATDSGQACIIHHGQVVAREGPEGTDAMLTRFCDPALRHLVHDGILFKAPKPGQDRRADLPVIGPETARIAADAGLGGIVIEEGGVMVLDLPAVRWALDRHGLFLWVRPWD